MKRLSALLHTRTTTGFSLIEVLVSLSIFTIVMVISVGALMSLIDANARARNMQTVMTNLSYALDSMTREMRTGTDYFCGSVASLPVSGVTISNCANGGVGFSFNEGGQSLTGSTPNNSRRIAFRLNGTTLERRLGDGDGDGNVNEAEDWLALTSPQVAVTSLVFHTTGATRSDNLAPTLTLYIEGVAGIENDDEAMFHIQTTVVQQLVDI